MKGSPTSFEERQADWLTPAEATSRTLAAGSVLPTEIVDLAEALGRVLAEPLVARATLPPWDNSAMDGYAVRAADIEHAGSETEVRLEVVGSSLPGETPGASVGSGQAVRIMTGAPLPAGADSVVRVEHTDREAEEPGQVAIRSNLDRHRNVRPAGQDMKAGEVVLEAGTTLTPGVLAVAAALGHPDLEVRQRPRVAVLSTGSELKPVTKFEDVVEGRGVPETNGVFIRAAAVACGASVLDLGIAADSPADIRSRVGAALDADLLVTSGGASMGEADLLKRVLEAEGLEVDFWRVRMRPGSPFSLARLPRPDRPPLPVLGLPGNPASAFVTFELFVRPLILRLAGHRNVYRRTVRCVAAERLPSTANLTHFHRVEFEEAEPMPRVRLAGPQSSGLVRGLGRAEGLAIVPEGTESVEAGESVDVLLLDHGPGSAPNAPYSRPGP